MIKSKKLYIINKLFDQNGLVKVIRPKMSDSYHLMILCGL